jgi:hypothetical protein
VVGSIAARGEKIRRDGSRISKNLNLEVQALLGKLTVPTKKFMQDVDELGFG